MSIDIRTFLEELDNSDGKMLFEGGKEGEAIDDKVKAAFKGVAREWIFQPDEYDLVVMEHDKDGQKENSWSISFFTEAEVGAKAKDVEDVFGEGLIGEAEVGYKVIDTIKGKFIDIINAAIEIAENKKYKQGFSAQNLKALKMSAKSKK